MKVKVGSLSWSGDIDIEDGDSLDVVKGKLSEILKCPAPKLSLVVGTDIWTDGKVAKDVLSEGATLSVLRSDGWGEARLAALKSQFEKHGEVQKAPAAPLQWICSFGGLMCRKTFKF